MIHYVSTLRNISARFPHILIALVALVVMSLHGLYCYSLSTSKSVIALYAFGVLVFALFYILYTRLRERDKKERLFLGALIVLGLCFCFIFPPGTVPDEIYHYDSTYAYSIGTPTLTDKLLELRNTDAAMHQHFSTYVCLSDYQNILSNFQLFAQDSGTTTIKAVSSFGIASDPPQTRFAAAFGILLGKAFGLGGFPTFYLGRIFNLAWFIVLVYAAVRITPVGKNIFMVVALLPMTLHLAASYSYDAPIIAYAFIFTALCLKCIFENKIQPPIVFILLVVFGCLLAPCKAIYSLVLLLVFFIPKRAFAKPQHAKWFKCGLLIAGIALFCFLQLSRVAGLASTSSDTTTLNSRGSETGHLFGLADVIADPEWTLVILLNTFNTLGWFYLYSMVGTSLGWFQVELITPYFIPCLLLLVVFLSCIIHPKDKTVAKPPLRIACAIIFVLILAGSVASMLLGHTFITEKTVQGVQGRYLLPALPLLLLAIRGKHIQFNRDPKNAFILFFVWFNMTYLLWIFATALSL